MLKKGKIYKLKIKKLHYGVKVEIDNYSAWGYTLRDALKNLFLIYGNDQKNDIKPQKWKNEKQWSRI